MFALKLHERIQHITPEHILLHNGNTKPLPPKLKELHRLTSHWQRLNELQTSALAHCPIDALIDCEIAVMGAGNALLPSETRRYFVEQFPEIAAKKTTNRWLLQKIPTILWFGLPYEALNELRYSTSVGCTEVISAFERDQCPVFGIFPYLAPSDICHQQLHDTLKAVYTAGLKIGLIGGDHRVTWSLLTQIRKAFPVKKRLVYIHVDAHHDLYGIENTALGTQATSGIVGPANFNIDLLRNAVVDALFLVGCRDRQTPVAAAQRQGFPVHYLDMASLPSRQPYDHWHLSIDIDVLDPSIAPGVTNPIPNGWTQERLYASIETMILQLQPDSYSVVETATPGKEAAHAAANTLLHIQALSQG